MKRPHSLRTTLASPKSWKFVLSCFLPWILFMTWFILLFQFLQHINDITGTIELEPMLKKSEAIYLQMKACGDSLPEDIQSILGMDEPSSNTSTPDHEKAKSSASTPERALSSGMQSQSLHAGGSSNGSTPPKQFNCHNSSNSTVLSSTPDDSSIEILSDHMDLVF